MAKTRVSKWQRYWEETPAVSEDKLRKRAPNTWAQVKWKDGSPEMPLFLGWVRRDLICLCPRVENLGELTINRDQVIAVKGKLEIPNI